MNKIITIITIFGILILLSSQVQAVMFANDYITLYKDEEPLPDKSIIIMTFDEYTNKSFFTELYENGEFIRNQQDSLILTFYEPEQTPILSYYEWFPNQEINDHEDYRDNYISTQIENSTYNITITLPKLEDNTTYGGLFGGVIGSYRYFDIDIKTGSITLVKTEIPETPGFESLLAILSILIISLILWKKKKLNN